MFKRYKDPQHWGLFIPVGRKKWLSNVFDISNDECRPAGWYRMHYCITLRISRVREISFREIRVRFGFQYL
jgi:hypothetical protein